MGQRDGLWGLVAGGVIALAIHGLFVPVVGVLEPLGRARRLQATTSVQRLAQASGDRASRVEIDIRSDRGEDEARPPLEDPDLEPPGQVVSLPEPEQEERPDTANHASEWNQRTERETVSRDQRALAPAVTRALQDGVAQQGSPAVRAAERLQRQPRRSSGPSAGPNGDGQATAGSSGSDRVDGGGERMFALELPRQAARAPLELALDVDGTFRQGEAAPEAVGNGETARLALGNRPQDLARRSGAGRQGEQSGQGLVGGGDGSAGLPNLAQLTPSPQLLARAAGAPANDHLPELEFDTETRLNTWQWKHATFFNRIADAIRREWQGAEVLAKNDPGGRVYGFENRTTVVRVTLDRSGNVVDVDVAEPSGAHVLDEEAVRAFKEGGPFLNPPSQLFQASDRFSFRFGFNISFNRSHFDLDWRPQ